MPTLLTAPPEIPAPAFPPRKRWTREQLTPLQEAGLFEIEKLELVDGELISKMGKNRPHVISFTLMYLWLIKAFGDEFVNAEAPIDVSPVDNPANEPVPDLIVLNRKFTAIRSANPQPQEISLIVEIADTSLNFDLNVKAPLYARAGISEYWVLDINDRRLFCHRDPAAGRYADVAVYAEHENVAPLSAPEALFTPAQVF
jgi:Uma2 family endonuclease